MIYNLKKQEVEKVILSSLLKSFATVILLHIINFIVYLIKALPVESVRFTRGLFYINDEAVSFSVLSSLKMFVILYVLFCVYGIYKLRKEKE
jgi:cell division septal protein FtsQ